MRIWNMKSWILRMWESGNFIKWEFKNLKSDILNSWIPGFCTFGNSEAGNLGIWENENLKTWEPKKPRNRKLENLGLWGSGILRICECGNLKYEILDPWIPRIWESGNLEIWESENLRTWQNVVNLTTWESKDPKIWDSVSLRIWEFGDLRIREAVKLRIWES